MNSFLTDLPADILGALRAEPRALEGFCCMPATHRQAWLDHVGDSGRARTREARIERLVDAMAAAHDAIRRPA